MNESMPFSSSRISREEQDLLLDAINEYEDQFPLILTNDSNSFMKMIERYLQINVTRKGKTVSQRTFNKILTLLQKRYLEPEHSKINKLIQSSDRNNMERYLGTNYIPHCNYTKTPIHSCGNTLFVLDSYLVCLDCKLIYRQSSVLFHCDKCDVDYYTSIDKETGFKYKPATLAKYHCNPSFHNETMKCLVCRNCLYINLENKKLVCLYCKKEIEENKIKRKCIYCKQEFTSEAKLYNKLEIVTKKLAIKKTLYDCKEAKPDCVPCCGIDVKKCQFLHKKECKGIMFLGTLDKLDIVVCSKCLFMCPKDYFQWYCPNCKETFFDRTKINTNPRLEMVYPQRNIQFFEGKESSQQRRKKSQILDYNEQHNPISFADERYSSGIGNKVIDLGATGMKGRGNSSGSSRVINASPKNLIPGGVNVFKLNLEQSVEQKFQSKSPGRSAIPLLNLNINSISNNIKKIMLPPGLKRGASSNQSNSPTNASSPVPSPIPSPSNSTSIQQLNPQQTQEQSTIFSIDNYKIIRQIGQGTFGKIYHVEDKNKQKFAMKKILASSLSEINSLKNELDMLSSLSKSKLNLINIYGKEYKQLDKTTFVLYVLMDLADRDWEKEIELRKYKNNFYTETELLKILKELVYTFSELQRKNISHRDIKPQNVLVLPDKSFRIADFGEAKELLSKGITNTIQQTIRGTELYMSPILFKALNDGNNTMYTEHNTYKSDVYSLGLCFLFAAALSIKPLVEIRQLDNMLSMKMTLTKYLKMYSTKFTDVLYMMLEVNEKDRKDFIELNQITERFKL